MKLLNFIPDGVQGCSVEAWLHTHNQTNGMQKGDRPAVVICPGGGYVNVSEREDTPTLPLKVPPVMVTICVCRVYTP